MTRLKINGVDEEVAVTTIAQLLAARGIDPAARFLAVAVNGAVVLSLRGGDFELTIGRDLSIAYQSHTDKAIRLYLVETMAFRVLTPEAAVALAHKDAKGSRKG